MLTRRPIFTVTQAAGTLLQERVTVRHDPSQNVTHTQQQRYTTEDLFRLSRHSTLCCAVLQYAMQARIRLRFGLGFVLVFVLA